MRNGKKSSRRNTLQPYWFIVKYARALNTQKPRAHGSWQPIAIAARRFTLVNSSTRVRLCDSVN